MVVDIKAMFEKIMINLSKLDAINSCIESMDKELKEVKNYKLEFVHVQDLKVENKKLNKTESGETETNKHFFK